MNKEDLNRLSELLESLPPEDGLALVADYFGDKAAFSTSLGLEDQVITHWIATRQLNISIFTIDTGRLHQETYDLLDITRKQYHLDIDVYFPQNKAVETLINKKGPNSFYDSVENRKECCNIRKVEPLRRALQGISIWITGLRASQSQNRSAMSKVSWDEQHGLIKFNPLLSWSEEAVQSFIDRHKVPVNVLHKKGFPSIGCVPCTRAVLPGEDSRAGRWWWEDSHKECGLHETKVKVAAQ